MNGYSSAPSPLPHPLSDSLEEGISVVLRKEIPSLLRYMAAGGAGHYVPVYTYLTPPPPLIVIWSGKRSLGHSRDKLYRG